MEGVLLVPMPGAPGLPMAEALRPAAAAEAEGQVP